MAYSRLQYWYGHHALGNDMYLVMRYDVYYDVSNFNNVPYMKLSSCKVCTAQYKYDSVDLSTKIPMTLQLSIGTESQSDPPAYLSSVTGANYSFNIRGTVNFHQGEIYDLDYGKMKDSYYYVSFSDSTQIKIPKDALEFTINLTLTTKNGAETYTITEHAAGPMGNTLTGSASIYTGKPSVYQLGQPITCKRQLLFIDSALGVFFEYGSTYSWKTWDGYVDPYLSARNTSLIPSTPSELIVDSITFAPACPDGVPAGTTSKTNASSGQNIGYLYYYYVSSDLSNRESVYGGAGDFYDRKLLLTSISKTIVVTARAAVDGTLLPEFISFSSPNVTAHVNKYGACVQNQTDYETCITCMIRYGFMYKGFEVSDYKNGKVYRGGKTRVVYTTSESFPGRATYYYSGGLLDTAINNGSVEYQLTDYFGNVTSYVDAVSVLAYHSPTVPIHNTRRCSQVSSGSGTGYYNYDGRIYKLNDNGNYVLIEWGVSITPLNDINSRKLVMSDPASSNRNISLSSYDASGYYVVAASTETSYNISFKVTDDFSTTQVVNPLNTAISAIDFLSGGRGLAFGKIAETANTMDIHRDWTILMPYNTMIQNYYSNGTAVRLYDWMTTTANRIQAIIDSRNIQLIEDDSLYNGTVVSIIPSSYGNINNDSLMGNDSSRYTTMRITTNNTAGMLIGNNITISRNYLHIEIERGFSFIRAGWGSVTGTVPKIYIMGTKPTTIDQSTGVPNGTVKKTVDLGLTPIEVGDSSQGYMYYSIDYKHYYIDVSSYSGQTVWIVITARHGACPSSYFYQYTMKSGISLGIVEQTNIRV